MRPHSLLGCSGRFGQAGQHQPGLEGTSELLRPPGSHRVPYLLATVNDCPCRSLFRHPLFLLTRLPPHPLQPTVQKNLFNYLSNRPPQSLQTCLNRSGNCSFARTLMMLLKSQSCLEKSRKDKGCEFVRGTGASPRLCS